MDATGHPAKILHQNCHRPKHDSNGLSGSRRVVRLGELAADDKTTTHYLRTSQWQSTASQGMATLTLLQGKSVQWRQPIDVIHPIEDNPGCAAKLINELISNRQAPCATDPLFQGSKGRPNYPKGIYNLAHQGPQGSRGQRNQI